MVGRDGEKACDDVGETFDEDALATERTVALARASRIAFGGAAGLM
jgi:hypothetical protein